MLVDIYSAYSTFLGVVPNSLCSQPESDMLDTKVLRCVKDATTKGIAIRRSAESSSHVIQQ